MNPQRLARSLRRAALILALLGMGYLLLRYRIVSLPAQACSPLHAVPPGSRLLVDTRWPRLWPGDVVLYRARKEGSEKAALWLGRLRSLSPEGCWIETDRDSCPSPDSRSLGPLPERAIEARVLWAWGGG